MAPRSGKGQPPSIEKKLLDDSPDAVLFVGPEWQIGYANRRAAELAQASTSDISGNSLWTTFPELSDDEAQSHCRRAMAERVQIEFERETRSGRWVRVCARPQDNGLALYCREIQSSDDAIISNDLNGVITSWNDGAQRLFGYTSEEAIGRPAASLLIPDDRQQEEPEILSRLRRGERVDQFETKRKRKDGTLLDISLTISPVKDSQGRIIGAFKIARDITDRQRKERESLLLGAIVDSSDDAIISKDLNGVITSWNRSAERIFGYTSEEAVGQSVTTLLIPADRQLEEVEILSKLRRGERVEHFETKRKCKDGTLLDISLTISPVKDSQGRIIGASKIAHDITDRQRKERASQLLSAIVDSSDDAIISKDLNGVITSWNKSAERIFGYTPEEAVGQAVAALLIPADRQDEEPEILRKLRCGERVDHFETKRKRKDGALLDVSVTISPIMDSQGRIIGASKTARNITEQVKNQEALRSANEALQRSNADLEQFAYSASHDLQEPLRMVSTYGEMLRRKYDNQLDARAEEYIGYIVEGGSRMERLLRDLRAFTHASLAAHEPPPIVDSQTVLDSALTNLTAAIGENGAEITSGHLPCVAIHEFQLEQLFQNIIGNAIRYRSEASPRIHVDAARNGRYWRFSIRDNGIGIDPEYKEQVFGIFKRLHASSEYPGTGMGLAICQRVVERAGGRIWVDSEPGRGSTFFFELPDAPGN